MKSGSFTSSSEVVRAGLRLLAEREAAFGKVKALLIEADNNIETGNFKRFENTDYSHFRIG